MQLEANEREIDGNKILRINNYEGYDFHEEAGVVSYSIHYYYEVEGYDGDGKYVLRSNNNPEYFIVKPMDFFDNFPLTTEVVNQWGADDQIIFDYLAEKLGLTLV